MESITPMNSNIDFNALLKKVIPLIIIVLLAMVINTVLYLFLPKDYISTPISQSKTFDYRKYKLKVNFDEKKLKIVNKIVEEKKKEYALISNIILKMIYQEKMNSGWIVISEKSSKESIILGLEESYKNYKLSKIYNNYVIFVKNNKEYKLPLNTNETKTSYKMEESKDNYNKIEKIDDEYHLKRDLIKEYTKNSSKIWKEISIKEILKDGKIDGFKITRISQKSVFKSLGLLKGDIIKSVNNVQLKSYADAFGLYKKINKVKNMKFIVLRGDEEVELEYEIK